MSTIGLLSGPSPIVGAQTINNVYAVSLAAGIPNAGYHVDYCSVFVAGFNSAPLRVGVYVGGNSLLSGATLLDDMGLITSGPTNTYCVVNSTLKPNVPTNIRLSVLLKAQSSPNRTDVNVSSAGSDFDGSIICPSYGTDPTIPWGTGPLPQLDNAAYEPGFLVLSLFLSNERNSGGTIALQFGASGAFRANAITRATSSLTFNASAGANLISTTDGLSSLTFGVAGRAAPSDVCLGMTTKITPAFGITTRTGRC